MDGYGGNSSRNRNHGKRGGQYTDSEMSGAYGHFDGNFEGSAATVYGGYGFGYGGPMYCFGGYGLNSYGNPGGYGGCISSYEDSGGYDSGKVAKKDDGPTYNHPYWKSEVGEQKCHQAWQKKKRKMTRVSKLVNRVLDKYEKLPASLKDHINLEEMLGMKMKRSVETQNTTSRGPQHPINEKLERFKVRPVFPYEEDNKN
ncbi:hypothetical protein JHK82_041186 [Glycine max]|nr:hypothetical protein JHK82_041186 [Glycine max]